VLDDVQRRRFPIDPAGEDPAPFLVGALHVQLEKRACQFLLLPRSGRLAGAQANDRIAGPDRLPRLHPQIVDDSVALVEEADDRDPVLHRSEAGLVAFENLACVRGLELLLVGGLLLPARRQRHSQRDSDAPRNAHSYSGFQGW
jgi:hypothetical protein